MEQLPVERKRARWDGWDWSYWVVVAGVTGWAGFEANFEYFAGVRNRGQVSMGDMGWMLMGCVLWFVPGVWALLMAVTRRCSLVRKLCYAGLGALPLVVGFGWHSLVGSGAVKYQAGFVKWIDREVDGEAIRGWMRTRPGSAESVRVGEAEWPAEIRRLKPERVDLWKDRGVAMTWGVVSHDGDRRQVFVGREAGSPPPTEVMWAGDRWEDAWQKIENGWPAKWEEAKPGVWWWVLGQS